ncbi:hypothetical protein PhCBS80983_g04737 [Powellomyces hirtus]|uniref:Uncharacterized protein n=1 Tax=Powellomyces hirtus TaxID=109895 RepID=A0A507DWL2_9FUNG|nr:hypothetical protein PhCBS80983_g04737 [Powellomyces hirtus]
MSTEGFCHDPEGFRVFSLVRPTDFSVCFEDVVVTLAPLAIFVAAIFPCVLLRSSDQAARTIRPSRLGTLLMILCAFASIAFSAARIVDWRDTPRGPIVFILSTIAAQASALLIQVGDYMRGKPARPALVCCWIWIAFTSIVKLRTLDLSNETESLYFSMTLGVLVSSVLWIFFEEALGIKSIEGKDATGLEKAGLLSYLTFAFIWGKLRDSRKYKLASEDVWKIPFEESTDRSYERLTNVLRPSTGKFTNMGLCAALIKSQLAMTSAGVGLKVLASVFMLVQPLLLDALISYVSSHNTGDPTQTPQARSTGFLIAIAMLLTGLVAAVMNVWGSQLSWLLYYRWKIATASTVFRKSLRLSPSARVENTTGNVSNILSNDAMEVGFMGANIPDVIAAVVQIVVGTALIWVQLGISTVSVVVFVILLGPLQTWNAKFIEKWSDKQFEAMDTRLGLTTEIMNGMKIIKMYAWESFFVRKLEGFRKSELGHLFVRRVGEIFGVLLGNLPPVIMFLVALGISTAIEKKPLDVNRIFVSLALFNLMKAPLYELSMSLPNVAVSWACVNRVVTFLNEQEIESYVAPNGDVGTIHIKEGEFTWAKNATDETDKGKPTLAHIDLEIKQREFVGVVGKVGSGKSSLLSALLGQMEKTMGHISIGGTVVYVSQRAWIFQGTIRDNILIGRPYNTERYKTIVEACALSRDLELLAAGDKTEIGERGVNLSGGQRQRVSLARAIYGDADIYLFDDVLSAVDRHVARHIFDHVLGHQGLLAHKTRVLATHAVHVLKDADRTLLIEDGQIVACDSYEHLVANKKISEVLLDSPIAALSAAEPIDESADAGNGNGGDGDVASEAAFEGEQAKLIEEEETENGRVSWGVLMMYLRACSFALFGAFFLGLVVSEGVNLGSRYWLLYWNDHASENSLAFYFGIYIAWVLGYVILYPFAGSLFLCVMGLRAGRVLHNDLLTRVMKMPWSFFSVTPVGRIMTRFSSNLGSVDVGLPDSFYDMIFAFANVIVNILPTVIGIPQFLVVVGVAALVCYLVMHQYIPTSVAYLRIKSTCDSFIWSHVDETLNGIDSVRAYNLDVVAAETNAVNMDRQQAALIMFYYANRWFSLWITIVSTLVVFASAISAVLFVDELSPSLVALSVSTILSIMQEVAVMMTKLGYLQTQLVDAERLKQYLSLPLEKDVQPVRDLTNWPATGRIEFQNVNMRYREDMDLVLKDLTFSIHGGQKIGIVGRTGAGKSSLALALLRMVEISRHSETKSIGGSIKIDDVDIATVDLATLRERLSIIPQEAFMFTGSLRENLDPFGKATDQELWYALEKVALKPFVQEMEGGLDAPVTEAGDNFSVGQKQLVCLARAVLRNSKILILDEATASVDNDTDNLIQTTLKTEFANCTVITIAHRVNTIMTYDRIIVMDAGRVVESGAPRELLADGSSHFYSLVHNSGEN